MHKENSFLKPFVLYQLHYASIAVRQGLLWSNALGCADNLGCAGNIGVLRILPHAASALSISLRLLSVMQYHQRNSKKYG